VARPQFDDDDPAPRLAWIRDHLAELARVPLPGRGSTVERWRLLADLGSTDGTLARLAEGHLDAVAILAELGRPAELDEDLYGVWAARPERLRAAPDGRGWVLTGDKPWCSGADGLDRALLTATDPDGRGRLFDVAVTGLRFADDWRPAGMRASDSRTACVELAVGPDAEIGPVDSYVDRPGFWHGGAGVAACWHGLARHVGDDLCAQAAGGEDPFTRAAAGRATAALAASTALLGAAARQIDARPDDVAAARRRASTVRVAVEQAARLVLETSLAAQGASALCFDEQHARAVSDLAVYLGQLHPGHDASTVEPDADGWWSA
jgi:alkylation response protein AidB-like acyl-CoA dehydrogenase